MISGVSGGIFTEVSEYPGAHSQSSTATLPATDTEFAGHSAQSDEYTSTSQSDIYSSLGIMKYTYRPEIG